MATHESYMEWLSKTENLKQLVETTSRAVNRHLDHADAEMAQVPEELQCHGCGRKMYWRWVEDAETGNAALVLYCSDRTCFMCGRDQ